MSGTGQGQAPRRPQDMPTKAELARLRVEYGKDERLAFLGHLEVMGTVMRSVRRAGLPFSIGNGFARRMRIQFSGALPVGASSAREYFDVRLTERVDPSWALARLRGATPAALGPTRCAYVGGTLPALEAWLNRSTWEVRVLGTSLCAASLAEAVSAVRERGSLSYERSGRTKTVDVAGSLLGFSAEPCEGGMRLVLETRVSGTAALRPQVLLDAALAEARAGEPDSVRVRRLAQAHDEDGRLVEPLGHLSPEVAPSVS